MWSQNKNKTSVFYHFKPYLVHFGGGKVDCPCSVQGVSPSSTQTAFKGGPEESTQAHWYDAGSHQECISQWEPAVLKPSSIPTSKAYLSDPAKSFCFVLGPHLTILTPGFVLEITPGGTGVGEKNHMWYQESNQCRPMKGKGFLNLYYLCSPTKYFKHKPLQDYDH